MTQLLEKIGFCYEVVFKLIEMFFMMLFGLVLYVLYFLLLVFEVISTLAVFIAPVLISGFITEAGGSNYWWFLALAEFISIPLSFGLGFLWVRLQERIHEPIMDFLDRFDFDSII